MASFRPEGWATEDLTFAQSFGEKDYSAYFTMALSHLIPTSIQRRESREDCEQLNWMVWDAWG